MKIGPAAFWTEIRNSIRIAAAAYGKGIEYPSEIGAAALSEKLGTSWIWVRPLPETENENCIGIGAAALSEKIRHLMDIGPAAFWGEIENLINIEVAARSNEIENLINIRAAAWSNEIEYYFEIGAAGFMD